MRSFEERLRSIKAFVFDFYGTLAEDDVAVAPLWEQLNQMGYRSAPQLEAIFEPNGFDGCTTPTFLSEPSHDEWNRANWRQFVRLSGVPEPLVEATLWHLFELQSRFRARAAPSARSLLALLRRRGLKVGLCSNWESPIVPYLEQAGFAESDFDTVAISAEVGARKPHAAIFLEVCGRLGVPPSAAVFVGDNWSSDIVGALRVGLMPVWLRQGRAPGGLPHLVAEFESLAELEKCLSLGAGRTAAASGAGRSA